ncbi:MAG: hypothetical protein HY275_02435 [Gemmatimonadetes bacterium]|nr:hypothetical protein [Gemmatimonadota bacterium]
MNGAPVAPSEVPHPPVDALAEFLFKYRPAAFARGALGADPVVPVLLVVALASAVAGLGLWALARQASHEAPRIRGTLGGLRVAAIALLAWCLCRPVLVVAESVAQRNVVAVLVDDSRSMRIADVGGQTRAQAALRLAGGADSALLRALGDRYQVRVYRTSAPGRVTEPAALPFDGARTRLLGAVTRVEDELAGAPLAGVVVLTDGADNGARDAGASGMTEQLSTLRARGVPVYPVGLGSARFAKDIEVAQLEVPRAALRNATVLVDVLVSHRGFGGATLPVIAEDGGRIVAQGTVTLAREGEAASVRLRVPVTEAGARVLRVRVPPQPGELVTENNERRVLITVRDRKEKVLFVDGEPRPEIKFARRAVSGDQQLQLVTLLRSAKDKYLRLGVDDSLELVNGFPTTRAQLFAYRAIVLGSIEANFFTADQLRMLADFVSERGGGLLALGGRASFGEGGWAGTPLADVLPVELGVMARGDSLHAVEIKAGLTPAGLRHPALQVMPTDSTVAERWRTLPPLTTVNALPRAKSGATVLLEGTLGDRTVRPLLAMQRYGKGRVLALGAQDDWLWQMHAEMAVEDSTHERLWRQMLRWLVSEVPDRAELAPIGEAARGEAVSLRALVRDSVFLGRNGASVSATVTAPGGKAQEVAFDWAVDRDGEYAASFVPDSDGVHEVRVRAVSGRDTTLAASAYVLVADPTDEYFGAERRDALLAQLANETGGHGYDADHATDVARDLVYSPSGATQVRRLDLWDMPVVFVVLTMLLGGEWWLRRRRGLA